MTRSKPHRSAPDGAPAIAVAPGENERMAADPATHPSDLQRLSQLGTRAERELVASNPNAPVDALLKLAPDFPAQVAMNPSFELAQLCDPTLLEKLDPQALSAIASHPDAPPSLLARLASKRFQPHRDDRLVRHLLAHPALPAEARRHLIDSTFDDPSATWFQHFIAYLLASDPLTSPDLLVRFARMDSPSAELFEELAQNPSLPPDQLPRLLAAFPDRLGRLLAAHADTPPALLVQLTGSNVPEIRRLARQHPALPASWVALLDRAGFAPSLAADAAPPLDSPLDPADMEALYDGGWWFRVCLIRRPDTPEPLLARIRETADAIQRRLLARRDAG